MKKRILFSCVGLALAANLFVGAFIYLHSTEATEKTEVFEQMSLFVNVLEKVRNEYVDGDKLTYPSLVTGALKGMLNTLDPHSEYLEPRQFSDLQDDTEGEFGGVGINITLRGDALIVVMPMDESPAAKAGVLAGDRIVRINGESTDRILRVEAEDPERKADISKAVEKLRGKPGSEVTITVSRPSLDEPKDFKLTRAIIKVASVKDLNGRNLFPVDENKIGYTLVTQFGEQTTRDLKAALKKLTDQGMQGLVLDLRDNPGGLLEQAVQVCDLFLPSGRLIVTTEGQSAESRKRFNATGRDEYPNVNLVVLVNGGSASASEIVAGCLQDSGRAFVMGEQTFGKGSVQSILPVPGGAALRLTTAKYYTPSHKVIHEKGITPDSVVEMSLDLDAALARKRQGGDMSDLDPAMRERVKYAKDIQLERAVDFLKAFGVYKGRVPQLPSSPRASS